MKPNIFWEATLADGTIVIENDRPWLDIQSQVRGLTIVRDGVRHTLPQNMKSYIQGKSASAGLGGGLITIHSHFIGCELSNGQALRMDFLTEKQEVVINVNRS